MRAGTVRNHIGTFRDIGDASGSPDVPVDEGPLSIGRWTTPAAAPGQAASGQAAFGQVACGQAACGQAAPAERAASVGSTFEPRQSAPAAPVSGSRTAALAGADAAPGVAQERGEPLAAGAGMLIVASVVPLSLLQLPNMLGLGLPAAVIARLAGQAGPAELVRAAGLALPVMACAAPVAAVLARRHRAWPTLLAGLIVIGAADLLGNSVHSVLGIALDRALHGLGAGTALPASLALGWERSPRWRRPLSRWWVAVAVISLVGSVPLMHGRLAGGGWRAALQPFPWLTAVALAATAVYIAVTGGSGPQPRSAVTPAERTQLALMAVPLAGLGALDLGVCGQSPASVTAAAGVAVFILAGLALVTSADAVTGGVRGRLCFPLTGACAGFILAPTADAIAGPRPLALPLVAAAAAAAAGTGIARRDGQRRGGAARSGRPGSHAARHKSTRKQFTAGTSGNAALRCVLAGLACAPPA